MLFADLKYQKENTVIRSCYRIFEDISTGVRPKILGFLLYFSSLQVSKAPWTKVDYTGRRKKEVYTS